MINQLVVILFKYIDNHRVGGVGSNQYKKVEGAQSEPLAPNAKTYDIIARENNVSRETV